MFNCATLTLFIMVTCIFIAKCQKKEWMSERDRGPDSTAVHWNEKCCRQERAGLTNTHWLYRPDVSTLEVFFSFLFKIHFISYFFWSVQHSLWYSSPPPTHRPSIDWPELQWARGLWKTGQLHPLHQLNCLKLSNHNLAPWAAGPSLQARASLQTYRVAF